MDATRPEPQARRCTLPPIPAAPRSILVAAEVDVDDTRTPRGFLVIDKARRDAAALKTRLTVGQDGIIWRNAGDGWFRAGVLVGKQAIEDFLVSNLTQIDR